MSVSLISVIWSEALNGHVGCVFEGLTVKKIENR